MEKLFKPGKNIAIKVPRHEFNEKVAFYRDVLGLSVLEAARSPDTFDSIAFDFDGKTLWIDCVSTMSQAEIWLEILTTNLEAAKRHFLDSGCVIYDEIESLPGDFKGFWISSPSNIIHLVSEYHDN